jgi:hypothetical protein
MMNVLKLPMAGDRHPYNGSMYDQASNGLYWSSSPYIGESHLLFFHPSNIVPDHHYPRAAAHSIRCLKN